MRPITLVIRGFMSYGDYDTVIDFSGVSCMVISGGNGNGKSSIIDAITYALWGETRASSVRRVSETDYIHLGLDEMRLELTFEAGGETYKTVKRRTRRGAIEWKVFVIRDGEPIDISGSDVRETKSILANDILNMSFDMFINSSYFQQSGIDTFASQTPAERQNILSSVIDLSRYEGIGARLSDECAKLNLVLASAKLKVKDASDDLIKRNALVAERESVLAAIESEDLERRVEETKRKEDEVREAQYSNKLILDEMVERQKTIDALWAKSRKFSVEDIEKRRAELKAERLALSKVSSAVSRMDEISHRLSEIAEDIDNYERISMTKTNLIAEFNSKLGMLKDRASEYLRQMEKLESSLTEAESLDSELNAVMSNIDNLKGELRECEDKDALSDELGRLTRELSDLQRTRESAKAEMEAIASGVTECPVCGSEITEDMRETQLVEKRLLIEETENRSAQAKVEHAQLRKRLDTVNSILTRNNTLMSEIAKLEERGAVLKSKLVIANSNVELYNSHKDEHDKLVSEAGELRLEVAVKLEELEAESTGYLDAYNEGKSLNDEKSKLSVLLKSKSRLDSIDSETAQVERELQERVIHRDAALAQLNEATESLEKLRNSLTEIGYVTALETERKALEKELMNYRVTAESKLERISEMGDCENALREVEAEYAELALTYEDYKFAASCFSRNGIPSYILQTIIPEFENIANGILSDISDGMSIRLETERELKSGATQRTLDIMVKDDVGVRPYELFSGGEKFRINFAIRLAISELMMAMSGAKMKTLIIDEGFGSQDSEGVEKVVSSILAVSKKIPLVMVISHMDEVRESFPTRLEVVKEGAGSRITLL